MAFAGARFVNSLLEASVGGKSGVKECTYVNCDVVPGVEFFSTIVELGVRAFPCRANRPIACSQPTGAEKIHPVPTLTPFEKSLFDVAVNDLKGGIAKGFEFVKSSKA